MDTNEFARDLQMVRDVTSELNKVSGADLPELFVEMHLEPDVLGQIIMEHIPCDGEAFDMDSKHYWMEVAKHMGPDWIAGMKRVAAFMDKVESF